MEDDSFPKVTIITLNWNRKDDTVDCVKSLLKLDYPDYEIVVVDNGSTDGSAETFRETFPNITLIENKKNLGYALGFNTGIKYALEQNVKYVLILNNDLVIDENALKSLVTVAESDSRIGFVSGKVYDYYEPNKLQSIGRIINLNVGSMRIIGGGEIDHGQYNEIREYKFLDDVFWLVRTEVFKKVGMYDPNFFLQFEETDLCARANKFFKLVYTPYAKIWHKGGQSSGGLGSPTPTYYLARNKIIFMQRNASSRQFLSFILYFLLIQTPNVLTSHIKRKRFNSILPHFKGALSGMRWVIGNGKGGRM
jgi:GT2 family glycosyltransferase